MSCDPGIARRPIVVGTPMKCGTWLIRRVLSELTGLPWREPPMVKPMDPGDPRHVLPDADTVYSWHFVPTPAVGAKLARAGARVIFVVRNVFAMTLSMYHHFADDVDRDIGRGAGKAALFRDLGQEAGLSRIIGWDGKDPDDGFHWDGVGRHLAQMQAMLEFAQDYPCLVLSFERIVSDRHESVEAVSRFLGLTVSAEDLRRTVLHSGFEHMRAEALARGAGSHFRTGGLREYRDVLTPGHRRQIAAAVEASAHRLPELLEQAGLGHVLDWDNRFAPVPWATAGTARSSQVGLFPADT